MTDTTKISELSPNQVDALRMGLGGSPNVHFTATTVTFDMSASEALSLVRSVKVALVAKHGAKQHPVASIHAPIRKLAKFVGQPVAQAPAPRSATPRVAKPADPNRLAAPFGKVYGENMRHAGDVKTLVAAQRLLSMDMHDVLIYRAIDTGPHSFEPAWAENVRRACVAIAAHTGAPIEQIWADAVTKAAKKVAKELK